MFDWSCLVRNNWKIIKNWRQCQWDKCAILLLYYSYIIAILSNIISIDGSRDPCSLLVSEQRRLRQVCCCGCVLMSPTATDTGGSQCVSSVLAILSHIILIGSKYWNWICKCKSLQIRGKVPFWYSRIRRMTKWWSDTKLCRLCCCCRDAWGHIEDPPCGVEEVRAGFDSNAIRHLGAWKTLSRSLFYHCWGDCHQIIIIIMLRTKQSSIHYDLGWGLILDQNHLNTETMAFVIYWW